MRLVQCLMFTAAMAAGARADAALTAVPSFGANPGALDMFEYTPEGLPAGRPLVVVLHGCTQTATAMVTAGWNELADTYGFAVVYPQQKSANQQLSCFSWYSPTDISRTGGEAASIIAMVDKAIAEHGSDPSRVYVTGLSAGGAMTSVMLSTYPDRFAAGSVMAGLPYKCATSLSAASGCQQMTAGNQKTADVWGDLVRGASGNFSGTWPRMQIWQGTADYTVAPANATELVKQWTNVWNTDQMGDATDTVSTATRTRYLAGSTVAVELFTVQGMGHAIATGDDDLGACPSTTGAYFANKSICSTLHAAVFFGLVEEPADGDGSGSGSGSGSDSDGDGMPDETEDGGCSTSGTPGGAIMLAAIALLARRRRS